MLRDARIHLVCPLFVSVDARFRGPQPDLQLRLGESCFTKPKFWSANENFCSRNQISWSMSRWRMGNRLGAEGFRFPSRATPQLRARLVQDLLRLCPDIPLRLAHGGVLFAQRSEGANVGACWQRELGGGKWQGNFGQGNFRNRHGRIEKWFFE